MARVEGEIIIQRPAEDVFDFVADERNEPRYNPRMVVAELISDEPIGLGTRFRAELKTGRQTMPMTIELTGFDRPRRLASATHSSMMDTVGAIVFEPASAGTRMRWSWDVQPRGLPRLMPAVVGALGRRQERSIWGNLKRLLETEQPPLVGTRSDPMTAARPHPERATLPPIWSRPDAADATDTAGRSTVLLAYASAHGSTRGIAERIAGLLSDRAQVEVRPVDEIDDVEAYDTVILGSAVYGQRWIPSATTFVHRHAAALTTRCVWLFSVGSFGDTHRGIGRLMQKEPRDIAEIKNAVHPRDYRVFAGAIERDQWPLASRLFFHAFGGRLGDNRNWPEIDAWAESIARTLKASKNSR